MYGKGRWSSAVVVVGLMTATACFSARAGELKQSIATPVAAADDDGWRRTASGWERITEWNLRTAPSPTYWRTAAVPQDDGAPANSPTPIPLHPAGLAAIQILGVAAAFAAFSAGRTRSIRCCRHGG